MRESKVIVGICDDCTGDIRKIAKYVHRYAENHGVDPELLAFTSGEELLESASLSFLDILLLDIMKRIIFTIIM